MSLTLDDLEKIKTHAVQPSFDLLDERIARLSETVQNACEQMKSRPCVVHNAELQKLKTEVDALISIKHGVSKISLWIIGILGPVLTASLMKVFKL